MSIIGRLKKRWLAYLEKMAQANSKQYGNQRLDCCDLNGSKPEQTQKS